MSDQDDSGDNSNGASRRSVLFGGASLAASVAALGGALGSSHKALAQQAVSPKPPAAGQKPNILVIWGDDIGWSNVSAYGLGVMGYRTPNIDRIGKEGAIFTEHYAQPSCTAGRAAFITGQYPIRSGMTTVGQPGDPLGLQTASPSLAELMKDQGYATGHFGKSHLGDRIGNTWESTSDWYSAKHQADPKKPCCIPKNPPGGRMEDSLDLSMPRIRIPRKVIKGGSHLCAPSYCKRYRPAARHAEAVDTSTSHLGFRCVVRQS